MNFRAMLCALALAILSGIVSAQPTTPDVNFRVDATTNGVTSTTIYHLDRPALEAIGWQFGQYWRASEFAQSVSQSSGAACLVQPTEATPAGTTWNSMPPIPNTNFDWTKSRIVDPRDQAILSIAPATGAVYRNALRLGNATVQKLCVFGDIYGKGKTSGNWSRWDAATKTWIAVPLDRDASVLE